jgi:hypothetical protein
MFPAIPHRYRETGQVRQAPISEHHLVKAHVGAAELACALRRGEGREWSGRAWNLAISGAVPLSVYLLLQWPAVLLVAMLVVDAFAVWGADRLRWLRAAQAVESEVARVADADAYLIARAMSAPSRALSRTDEIPGWPMVSRAIARAPEGGIATAYRNAHSELAYSTTTGILPIRDCHWRGPVMCTDSPLESTATVTGMSRTSNS